LFLGEIKTTTMYYYYGETPNLKKDDLIAVRDFIEKLPDVIDNFLQDDFNTVLNDWFVKHGEVKPDRFSFKTAFETSYQEVKPSINLMLEDLDSKLMVIGVRSGKGGKDRLTLLSENVLIDLRIYSKTYRPKIYLFEGPKGNKYSTESGLKIIKTAAK
jgi:site-specific recombinase XerD